MLLLIASAWVLLRSGDGNRGRRRGVITLVSVLVALQVVLTIGPPPLGPLAVAGTALVLFAAVAWGAWRAERRASGDADAATAPRSA